MEYFLFNGRWPISILPETKPWGAEDNNGLLEQLDRTETDIKQLKDILTSRKKVFTINKIRYVVEQRGTFKTE